VIWIQAEKLFLKFLKKNLYLNFSAFYLDDSS